MSEAAYDVVAVGNAIVDVIAPVSDAFLIEHFLEKDAITLIQDVRADELRGLFKGAVVAAGGSAACTG